MTLVKIDDKEYEIPPLRLKGDDKLVEFLERVDRMLNPYGYGLRKLEDLGQVPEDEDERRRAILAHFPPEARYTPREQLALMDELVSEAINRCSGGSEKIELDNLITVEDFYTVLDAVWSSLPGKA